MLNCMNVNERFNDYSTTLVKVYKFIYHSIQIIESLGREAYFSVSTT
jgi:hypothetical protein